MLSLVNGVTYLYSSILFIRVTSVEGQVKVKLNCYLVCVYTLMAGVLINHLLAVVTGLEITF